MEHTDSNQAVILVTGGRGFLGSRVVRLLAQNHPDSEIILIARSDQQSREDGYQARTIVGDLRDENLWAQIPKTITHVVHLAAVIPWQAEDRYRASVVTGNLLPLAYLIENSQSWPNLQQVIYSSSVSVYAQTDEFLVEDSPRQPESLYGASKLAGEDVLGCLEARGVRTVSLRLSSLYGYGQHQGTVLPIMVRRALSKQDLLIFGDGTRTQDFLHCEDAARAILLSFQKLTRGVYNIGTGIPVSMAELAETVSRVFAGGSAHIVYQPQKADNDSGIKLDVTSARNDLGYQPQIDLETGLELLKQELDTHR
jgi:UDP-glucose 4-epimerase